MKHLRAHNGADRGPGDMQGTDVWIWDSLELAC